MIDSRTLRGLSMERAEMYGKPHWLASYDSPNPTKEGISRYAMAEGAWCMVCGRPATNVHHVPARRHSLFTLETERGTHILRPSLIALCGSGTTGCHGDVHDGRIRIEWAWDADGNDWWDGRLLEAFAPHDPELYELGRWQVYRGHKLVREARL